MKLQYPPGAARAIAENRANGLKPAETVLIVLAGRFDWPNPQVYVDSRQAYRWDWLRGLNAVVLIDSATKLGTTLEHIDRAEPSQLDVVDFERGRGWQVVFTRPSLKTIKWPRSWVSDWLGDCTWHRELNQIKADAHRATTDVTKNEFELEPMWN